MKTMFAGVGKGLTLTALVLAMAGWVSVASAAEKMPGMKAGEHMMMLNGVTTQGQAAELKPGDLVAMVCGKCKSVSIERVTTEKGHIKTVTPGEKHLCASCSGTIEVVGQGKAAKDTVKHNCSNCGDQSVFCCATKPGSATPGMEKKN